MEVDLDANGTVETAWTPIYDHTGNLVKLTDAAGDVVARYDYGPFGESLQPHSDLVRPDPHQLTVTPRAARSRSKSITKASSQRTASPLRS